jgi:hypothetical protein
LEFYRAKGVPGGRERVKGEPFEGVAMYSGDSKFIGIS